MRYLLLVVSSLALCVGLWNHDWTLIIASCLLAFAWKLWDDDDLAGSA